MRRSSDAFRIDQHVGDVLHVADLPFAATDLEQRVVGGAGGVGRIEQQHAAKACAKPSGEAPILALDVVDDAASRPGQERRHHEADALAASRRGEAQHMLGSVMAKIGAVEPAEHNAIRSEQAGGLDLVGVRPARRAVGLGMAGLAGAPDRHADGDGDGDKAARGGDQRAFQKNVWRVGVIEVPPPEEGRRWIDR